MSLFGKKEKEELARIHEQLTPDVLELPQQIGQLDAEDRAVIRGEVRAMLRAEKYKKAAEETA